MVALDVDGLTFSFPEGWKASKYDEWNFYRNQFSRQFSGIKAVDILALDDGKKAFFIEVKDYRHPDTQKPSDLPKVIADKVLMTLAALLPAKLNANEVSEMEMAGSLLNSKKLHVVAHIEQNRAHQPIIDPADLKLKLAQLLRAVDRHPKVVSTRSMQNLKWNVN